MFDATFMERAGLGKNFSDEEMMRMNFDPDYA